MTIVFMCPGCGYEVKSYTNVPELRLACNGCGEVKNFVQEEQAVCAGQMGLGGAA